MARTKYPLPLGPVRKIDLNNFRVARSETARDINRRIMLNLVRKHQPISRADLARRSGLQRSTVSAITDELLSEHWLKEGAIAQSARGRKPRFLHLNVERAGIIGINVRPSTIHLALADLGGRFLSQESLPTPSDPDHFVRLVATRVRALTEANPGLLYEGIGV